MTIQIVLHPDLGVSSDHFIATWNADAAASQLATASPPMSKSPLESFPLDPQLQQALVFLGGVVGGIAMDVTKDLIKQFITDLIARQRAQRPSIRVEQVPQPDGAVLLVVHEEK